ncbi:MAG: protein-L-isoaspartate(D-aspartate) O-methyltransferase [Pelovirga sp.]
MYRREEKIQLLLEAIAADAAATAYLTGRSRFSSRVMKAMREVPREAFVPARMEAQAFDNRPLPIGEGQTISQPYIVALMTDLLDPEPDDIMLEVGTGSGYQAAILAALINKLYSIETIPALASRAREILTKIDCANVDIIIGDGYAGLPEHAPYDGIIVTAAAPYIPEPLTEQLKPGGKLVIPVGQPMASQQLLVAEKDPHGTVHTRRVLDVAFVPMVST